MWTYIVIRSTEYAERFAALSIRQLIQSAVLAALGHVLLAAVSVLLAFDTGPADVLALYCLFTLNEMGYELQREPRIYLLVAAIAALLANLVNLLVF